MAASSATIAPGFAAYPDLWSVDPHVHHLVRGADAGLRHHALPVAKRSRPQRGGIGPVDDPLAVGRCVRGAHGGGDLQIVIRQLILRGSVLHCSRPAFSPCPRWGRIRLCLISSGAWPCAAQALDFSSRRTIAPWSRPRRGSFRRCGRHARDGAPARADHRRGGGRLGSHWLGLGSSATLLACAGAAAALAACISPAAPADTEATRSLPCRGDRRSS